MSIVPGALGRRAPSDWKHVERFPLTAETFPDGPSPVVIGVNWYVEFDRPERDSRGRFWVARDGKLTRVRGGHCVCLLPGGVVDNDTWWDFYDQGNEGACVGFGSSRAMSLLNRGRYAARWLWDRAKATDEWPETSPGDDEGTSVRAGLEILRAEGHVRWGVLAAAADGDYEKREKLRPASGEGISAYRWARSADEVLRVLGTPELDYVTVLNSWGRSYPHRVRMPAEVLETLRADDGEVAVITDR